jgi:hypothetical protein
MKNGVEQEASRDPASPLECRLGGRGPGFFQGTVGKENFVPAAPTFSITTMDMLEH